MRLTIIAIAMCRVAAAPRSAPACRDAHACARLAIWEDYVGGRGPKYLSEIEWVGPKAGAALTTPTGTPPWRDCAVVSNSARLRNKEHGARIDAADAVGLPAFPCPS